MGFVSFLSLFFFILQYFFYFLIYFLYDFLIVFKITQVALFFFLSLLNLAFLKGLCFKIKLIDFILQHLILWVLRFWVENLTDCKLKSLNQVYKVQSGLLDFFLSFFFFLQFHLLTFFLFTLYEIYLSF